MERAAENGARHVAVETPHACEGGREERQRFVEPTRAAALAVHELLGGGVGGRPVPVAAQRDVANRCVQVLRQAGLLRLILRGVLQPLLSRGGTEGGRGMAKVGA